MGILVQVLATVLLCFSNMNMGIFSAWPSSTILLFKSENTTLDRPMTAIEISCLGSLPTFGSLLSHPVVIGCILDRLGRKYTALLATSFFVVAWSIIALTNRVEAILTAMFIGGCGLTIFLESVIYVSEICQNSIRGILTSGPNLVGNFGYLASYFLGGALEYHMMVYTCLLLSVIGVLMILVLKESPVILMVKGKETDAAKSLAFYRRTSSTSKEVTMELNSIRRTIQSHLDDAQSLTRGTEIVGMESKSNKLSCWQLFKTTPSTRRQFYLVMVLKSAYVLQGLPVVLVYAEPMFAATVGTGPANLCSVLLGFVTLVTGVIAAYLTDKIGRRPLQIHSSTVAGICCAILGTQILTEWFPKWTIPLFVCVFAMAHTVGSGTIPFVVGAEIFLPEVKSILLVVAAEWLLTCHFSFLFIFNFFVESAGLAPVFFFFSLMCFASTVYFYFYLPETKGLSAYAIQALFIKKNEK